ncbi:MAG: hypothetical protein K5765_03045 [Clostridia bacterium]|nr:hypothetical protein [Clostridia bacterium]
MNLLKIGMLNTPENRWKDSLSIFDNVTVLRVFEEKEVEGINVVSIKFKKLQWLVKVILNRTKKIRFLNFISVLLILVLRMLCYKKIKIIKTIEYDEIHVSYNDFDESSLLFMLFKPYLKKDVRITRAYKEMRNNYDYLEKCSFLYADRIVFTTEDSKLFIENKYGNIFQNKDVVCGLDEDYRLSSIINNVTYAKKISDEDKKIHAVILAGRVLSNPFDKRSGSRLYYIDLIQELLSYGVVVHLQAKKITDYNGKNPYYDLEKSNDNFIIEHDIDFSSDALKSYNTLSKYDVGILHAHHNNKSSYEFDRINIPNRYYEYEISHVVPIEIKGKNVIMDRMNEQKKALCLDSFKNIKLEQTKDIIWDTPSFSFYINSLYGDTKNEQ